MEKEAINPSQMEKNARHCAQRGILIPTFEQMRDPGKISADMLAQLKTVGLWDIHPANLFRITWKNQPQEQGGGFGGVNYLELPTELTGTKARIFGMCGKWFPTGAHKVGATFGCIVPDLVCGLFDPASSKAAWPSTGNYCRGGAYVSKLLDCESIAILPEGMSRERFEWLAHVANEVIKTPGSESNVKEIFDTCWELKRERREVRVFNQFEEAGNMLWHHEVTGPAMEEVLRQNMGEGDRFAGCVLSSGSGGTLASAYYLKDVWQRSKLAASEALQCPTLLNNGYGDHRIEGIGDKHVPWIHDAKNTDMAIAVDDNHALRLLRLFNEEEGKKRLKAAGVDEAVISRLNLLGISGIANMIAAIKFSRYYELTEKDSVITVFTDSMQLYGSRLEELNRDWGPYTAYNAYSDLEMLHGMSTDHLLELSYYEKKRIHNSKYYTWVEQQGRNVQELDAQWNEHDSYWAKQLGRGADVDQQINAFNDMVKTFM